MFRYGWIVSLLGLVALTLGACQPVVAEVQAQPAVADCRMQGAWVGSFSGGAYDMPLIFQSTITPHDPAGDKLTYVMRWVNPDVTFKNPQLEETDYISELVGEAIKTGPNTYDYSVIGYGVKERPGERNGITYILEVNGSLTCEDGNNIVSDVNVSVYLGDQDADQDAFPDEGAKPLLCIGPISFGAAQRAPMIPRCESAPE